MNISIVIPVYKKKEIFLANLAHNLEFLRGHEIIVVDDCSKEGIKQDVQDRFSGITFIEQSVNRGFAGTVNRGVRVASGEYVLLLNSDVRLKDRSYEKAVAHFSEKNVFAVSFLQVEKHSVKTGKNILFYKHGFILHDKADDLLPGLNGWAEGGACIVRKRYFQSLGGFDRLYSPFYWEDVDLSYKAYKRGWVVLFDPSVEVEHQHETTIGSLFSSSYVRRVALRNQFVFFWLNVADPALWARHIIRTPIFLVSSLLRFDFDVLIGLLAAKMVLPKIILKRTQLHKRGRVSDREILDQFKGRRA